MQFVILLCFLKFDLEETFLHFQKEVHIGEELGIL